MWFKTQSGPIFLQKYYVLQVPQTPYRGFAAGPHLRLPSPDPYTGPQLAKRAYAPACRLQLTLHSLLVAVLSLC